MIFASGDLKFILILHDDLITPLLFDYRHVLFEYFDTLLFYSINTQGIILTLNVIKTQKKQSNHQKKSYILPIVCYIIQFQGTDSSKYQLK